MKIKTETIEAEEEVSIPSDNIIHTETHIRENKTDGGWNRRVSYLTIWYYEN